MIPFIGLMAPFIGCPVGRWRSRDDALKYYLTAGGYSITGLPVSTGCAAAVAAFPHTTDGEPREAALDSHSRGQGGLIISTNDMSKLLIELMETFQGNSDTIISPGTMKAMLVKHVDIPEEALGFPIGMGLGVLVDGEGDDVSLMHPGHSYPGTVFLVVAFPGLGQGMAFGANNNIGDRLEVEVASTLAELYGWPSGNYFSGEAESQEGEP